MASPRLSHADDGGSVWVPLPSLSQTYVPPPPPPARVKAQLHELLLRVAAKLNERSFNAYAELQHSKLRLDRSGIRNPADLAHALQYFHCTLSESELALLFNSFPSATNPGYCDMRALASALFKDEEQAFGRDDTAEKAMRGSQRGTMAKTTRTQRDTLSEHTQAMGQPNDTFGSSDAEGGFDSMSATNSLHQSGPSASNAAAISGFQTSRARQQQQPRTSRRPTVDSLHTHRVPRNGSGGGSSLLAKAGGNTLQQGGGHGQTTGRPHHMPIYHPPTKQQPQQPQQPATSRFHGSNCLGLHDTASAAGGAFVPRKSLPVTSPRLDFVHLGRDAPSYARYERTADTQNTSRQPFVHTAR